MKKHFNCNGSCSDCMDIECDNHQIEKLKRFDIELTGFTLASTKYDEYRYISAFNNFGVGFEEKLLERM